MGLHLPRFSTVQQDSHAHPIVFSTRIPHSFKTLKQSSCSRRYQMLSKKQSLQSLNCKLWWKFYQFLRLCFFSEECLFENVMGFERGYQIIHDLIAYNCPECLGQQLVFPWYPHLAASMRTSYSRYRIAAATINPPHCLPISWNINSMITQIK